MAVEYFSYPTKNLSYDELVNWGVGVAADNGYDINQYLSYVNTTYPDADLTNFMIDETSKYIDFVQNDDGTYTALGYYTDYQQTNLVNPLDSNSSRVSRGTFRQAVNHGVTETESGTLVRNMTRFPASGSFADKASYLIGSVGSAIGAVSTGIALGKLIDSALYNANPDYWDSIGMSSLDPSTWNSITNGDDSVFAGMLNFILGLDPETGNSQAYMDASAFAYMAQLLAQNGWFNTKSSGYYSDLDTTPFIQPINYTSGMDYYSVWSNIDYYLRSSYPRLLISARGDLLPSGAYQEYRIMAFSDTPDTFTYISKSSRNDPVTINAPVTEAYTYNGKTVYTSSSVREFFGSGDEIKSLTPPTLIGEGFPTQQAAWVAMYGEYISSVEGVTDQPNATLPDTSPWTNQDTTLQSLQQQYPDLWNNALVWDSLQPDGTVIPQTYIPVPMPQFDANTDTQPISSNATQTDTIIQPTNDTLTKLLTQIVTATQPQTETESETPPANPTDTGDGTSPTPVPPVGAASALWSVYHPSQEQVNLFGAWLWTDSPIEQFKQMMNNPMEGIITIHKIFAPPVDAGESTIVIGRLDSNVPSAYVTQQYVTVDCGNVSIQENFGNVFDYVGTSISIYLPFIGIQPLNVDDVMRSTINVKYNVDLFTGACLATINVSRDGYNPILYQYTGVCSVEYPLSGGQHSSIINGFFGLMGAGVAMATGPAGTAVAAATGLAAASSVANIAKTTNARSGAFGANAGAMGVKKPYLIIERPQTKIAQQDTHYTGHPTNYTTTVGSCTGMIKARQVHVKGVNGTQEELDQIEQLLKDGILVTEY